MSKYQHILIICFITINVVAFVMYGIDKWKAKQHKWRISEAALLGLAVLGGSVGAWLGMKVWHHKTQHKKFKYGIPIILIAQIVILLLTSCRTKQVVDLPMPVQEGKYVPEHSPDVFLLMYDAAVGKEPLLKAIKEYKCEIIYDYGIINGMALKKPEDKTLEETMLYFKSVKGVTNVEYNHIIRLTDPVKPKIEIR